MASSKCHAGCELVFLLSALFFLIWGMCTPEWRAKHGVFIDTHEGLWQRCYTGECVYLDLVNTSGWLKNVQAIMVVAVATVIVASLCCLGRLQGLVKPEKRTAVLIQIILQYVGGMLCVAGPVLYVIKTRDATDMMPQHFGQSFITTVTAAVTLFIGAALSTFFFVHGGRDKPLTSTQAERAPTSARQMTPYTSLNSPLPVDLLTHVLLQPPDVIPEKGPPSAV